MRNDEGAELVEFALILPSLCMLLFGIISFGRAWNVSQTITRAAREGAKEIVMTTCATCGNAMLSADQVKTQYIQPAIAADNLDASKMTNYSATYVFMDPPVKSVCGIELSFNYPYSLGIPFLPGSWSNLTLTTDVRMRLENQIEPAACTGSVP